MRTAKIIVFIGLFLLSIYSIAMLFLDESKNFTVEKEINYPIEKVFPQFNKFQNFTQWNRFFADNKDLNFTYFSPYEGQGSAMHYQNSKNKSDFGDVFIRYENPNSTIKYHLYQQNSKMPYQIDVKFVPKGNKTQLIWYVKTPKQSFLKRSLNLISEDYIADNIDDSMKSLSNFLGGKVDKEAQMASIKFDSIMVEKAEGQLLLGINVSTSNKKGAIFKNILINHNKLLNFVTKDLDKKEDEFGQPVLITEAGSFKNKEVSYFYGFPLSKRVGITDNNFTFRTVPESQNYAIYFKGKYEARIRAINALITKAKKDTMRNGNLEELFVEHPEEGKDVVLKLSLPVYR